MRLSRIKLSGFKSFVDPTTVALPGDLAGIVGPNGCGKSNVIDAVRWVMGESSAKHLRGESMADVIFNGSTSRKPVGTAVIELIFDNSDGTLGGQYARYSEISVRRQVNREGQSAYYLNGTRCRRRDITDVFLGTGLGPRSYSIIEQGMISRVIEARPEELRRYLEEAAGISLYKERRRETERRIRDTLENLERLADIREEVTRQLDKLRQQAEIAERYKRLRTEARQRQAELHVLRMQVLETDRGRLEAELRDHDNRIEAAVARQREIERDAETMRTRHAEDSDHLNDIQARYYSAGSEIARLEQRINHQRELQETASREQATARASIAEIDDSQAQDRDKLAVLEQRIEELRPSAEEMAEREATAHEAVRAAQSAIDTWQARWEQLNTEMAEPTRVAQVERARIEQLEQRHEALERRRERLRLELEQLDKADEDDDLAAATERAEILSAQAESLRVRVDHLGEQLVEAQERVDALTTAHYEAQGDRHRASARLASLETLQDGALGNDENTNRWLAAQGLDAHERLAQTLDVTPGWERAVEVVLGDHLQAVLVDRVDVHEHALAELVGGPVALRQTQAAPLEAAAAGTLAACVTAPWPLNDVLARVRTAAGTQEARAMVAELEDGEFVVTPQGLCFGPLWVWAPVHTEGTDAGVIARERAITELRARLDDQDKELDRVGRQRAEAQSQLAAIQEQRDTQHEALTTLEREYAGFVARLEGQRRELRERRERREQRAVELEELVEEQETGNTAIHAARARQSQALERSESLENERQCLSAEKAPHQQALDRARQALDEAQTNRQNIALRLESATTEATSLRAASARLDGQRERLCERLAELDGRLAELADPGDELAKERQRLLDERLSVEHELSAVRARLGDADARLRELEQRRAEIEQEVVVLREDAEAARYRSHELKIRAQTQAEQLAELDIDRQEVAAALPEQATESAWEQEIEHLEAHIRRLGPINLAAIDEYQALEARNAYLEQQYADLTEALETLQSAIRRIDRETRQRFRETYERVNAGVQRLFPRLFGGGEAYLELTDDDLLETGVALMARPPGKKVSNIHLLSGGEKALTAVSLVFAIFELNPAPFCMLDEVDAPLDEANVGRFCDLLRELSSRVQFIVITHNKTTMATVDYLAGVTMSEPGVSRLVAVDVEAAVELAGA